MIPGESFALAPLVSDGHSRAAGVHAPAFVDVEDALVLLVAGARALIARLAALDGPPFEFAAHVRIVYGNTVAVVSLSSCHQPFMSSLIN